MQGKIAVLDCLMRRVQSASIHTSLFISDGRHRLNCLAGIRSIIKRLALWRTD